VIFIMIYRTLDRKRINSEFFVPDPTSSTLVLLAPVFDHSPGSKIRIHLVDPSVPRRLGHLWNSVTVLGCLGACEES